MLFTLYARSNYWHDDESRSGQGSNLAQTAVIRRELPLLFERLGIRTLLDIPCGDGRWMHHVDHRLDRYIGADIVPDLIEQLQVSARPGEEFMCLDAISDPLPQADAILSRDFFGHLSDEHLVAAVRNMKRSGAGLLIATTFPGRPHLDIPTGRWRPIDLERAPYSFGPPVDAILEQCTQGNGRWADKTLAVWRFEALPA